MIGNLMFKASSIAIMYASLNAKAVLCRTATERSLRLDVKRYAAGIESFHPNQALLHT